MLTALRASRPIFAGFAAFALACVAISCSQNANGETSGSGASTGGRAGGGRQGGRGGGNDRPTPVEVELVKRGTVARTSTISGMLEPIRSVGVNAQVGGILLSIKYEEGQRVAQGQVVAEIDVRELEAQARSAQAALAFAKSTFERSDRLFKQQIVTAAELERDRAAYDAALAANDQLKTRLGYGRVVAPISGMVTEKLVEAGDIVGAQTRLLTIADVSTLVTLVQVSELEVTSLRVGAPVPVTVDALGGEGLDGRIRRIFPAADSATRLIPVEVAVSGALIGKVRPGYSVRATFSLDRREGALLVPSRAVTGPAGARAVYVVNEGLVERRGVRVGGDVAGQTEVFDGVVEGDSIIVSGTTLLREGAKTKVVAPLGDAAPQVTRVDSSVMSARDTSRRPGGRL